MFPAVASLPSVFVHHFSKDAASTRVSMSSFDTDCANFASIDGMEKALGQPSAGLVFGVDKCNLRDAKIAGESARPVYYPQDRYSSRWTRVLQETLMRVICEA